jgi:hypothetical protein
MRSRLVKFGDDVGDGVADAGNLGERACRDDAIQRLRKRGKAVCRGEVRLRAVWITAAEGSSLRLFRQEPRHCLRVRLAHNL